LYLYTPVLCEALVGFVGLGKALFMRYLSVFMRHLSVFMEMNCSSVVCVLQLKYILLIILENEAT